MKLAIIGAGELAAEILDLIFSTSEAAKWSDIFCVDMVEDHRNKVVSEVDFLKSDVNSVKILIAMGEPQMRKKVGQKYRDRGFNMATLIHPLACVSKKAMIQDGAIVFPYVYVAPNANICSNAIAHTHAIIENDCLIGCDSFISSGAFVGAKTHVGETCFLGPNSSIRDSLKIGSNSIIGIGSTVVKDVSAFSIVLGNPAHKVGDNVSGKVFK